MLLGAAMGGDMCAADLLIRRLWPEGQEEPERPSLDLELQNRILRAQLRMIRGCVENGRPIPAEYLETDFVPPPWAHELDGMDMAQQIRHHQKRMGIRGRPEDVWGYKLEAEEAAQ